MHQRRVDACFDLVVDHACNRKEFDAVAQLAGVQDVALGDLGDALTPDLLGHDWRPERQRGQDRQLVGRIPGLDIVRRVRLGVPKLLRLAQRVYKGRATLGHTRQDVIRGAVDDADHAGDVVGGQVQLKRSNQGDAAADAGFIRHTDAL